MRDYDKYRLNHDLVLDLPFPEGTGTGYQDISPERTPFTNGAGAAPAWVQLPSGLWVLDFNSGTPDFIECAAAYTVYDFTSEAFTLSAWIRPDSLDVILFCRGRALFDGWSCFIDTPSMEVILWTNQAGNRQGTFSNGVISLGVWQHVVCTRTGPVGKIYVNGGDQTQACQNHVNPLTANRKLLLGIYYDEAASPYDGQLALPRIYKNVALTATQVYSLFNAQRKWFGV